MPSIVVVDHDVQPVARTQSRFGEHSAIEVGEHALNQLSTSQIGDEFVAVVAMETDPAVVPDVQAYPGPPTPRVAGADRRGHALPRVVAQPLQLIADHLALDHPGCVGVDKSQIAAPRTVDSGDRAQRRYPVRRGFENLQRLGMPIRSALRRDSHPQQFPG